MPSKKKKKHHKKAFLLEPILVKKKFSWPGLKLGKSSFCTGLGVFTTTEFVAGTMIPILGHGMSGDEIDSLDTNKNNHSHVWFFRDKIYGFYAVDGNPQYKLVGELNIALMINEDLKKKPNCFFKHDYVVVAKNLPPKTELTIFYGLNYNRDHYSEIVSLSRKITNYQFPEFEYPKKEERVKLLTKLLRMICKLEKEFSN